MLNKIFSYACSSKPKNIFFYEARRMPSMPISISSVHGAVGCPPLPAIFDSNSFVHFISFQLLPKYTKLPGSLEKQRKQDKSAFLAFSWTIGSPPQNSYPCTARKGTFFWPYYTTKRKNTAQKRAGQPFIMLLAYGNQHSFHFLSFRLRRSSMHAFSRSG